MKTKATAKPATDDATLARVRGAVAHIKRVEEKRMFGGVMFMVNDAMCISVRKDRLMFRIDPAIHDEAVARDGARTMTMRGRAYRGYVHVDASAVRTKKDFDYWVALALSYNAQLKKAPKKAR